MHRSTLHLAALLAAGLFFAVVTPTASAQSAVDCPNTVRAVNGCDDYVPARAAPSDPRTEAAARRYADPAYRAVAAQSARPMNGATAFRALVSETGSLRQAYRETVNATQVAYAAETAKARQV